MPFNPEKPDLRSFRHRLILERQEDSENDTSRTRPRWLMLRPTQARIEPIGGAERFDADQISNIQQYEIVERWNEKIHHTFRWFDPKGNRYFTIEVVRNWQERNLWSIMRCVLVPNS